MSCKICQSPVLPIFSAKISGKYKAEYSKCNTCGFLCAENPIWLEEAYKQSITNSDTGLLARNISLSRKVSVLIDAFFPVDGRYLDYAGGYGVFTRLMRDVGFQFFHTDPYTKNLFAAEFEWNKIEKMDGVTCFECTEHLENPMEELEKIFSISNTVLISTVVLPEDVPSLDWSYYGFEHGQHISFYSPSTLKYIAKKFGVFVVSVGNLHLFSPKLVRREKMKWLISKADRLPHIFSRKTLFKQVEKKMKRRDLL
jgi:hypothetical protein